MIKKIGLFGLISIVSCVGAMNNSGEFMVATCKRGKKSISSRYVAQPTITQQQELLYMRQQYISQFIEAVKRNNIQEVERLLSLDPLLVNMPHRDYPLSFAVSHVHYDMVLYLLNKGADVNAQDKEGMAALHWISFTKASYVEQEDELYAIAKLLLEHGADINLVADQHKTTALQLAALKGYTSIVQLLLEQGAHIEAREAKGATALHLAAIQGHYETVKLLLSYGANIHACTMRGDTPLHVAAFKGHKLVTELLLKHGALVNAGNNENETPLIAAASNDKSDVVETLLAHAGSINAQDIHGNTALSHAALHGYIGVVKLLLNNKADFTITSENGATPLHLAILHGHTEVVKILLECGADSNVQLIDGNTPLHTATMGGHDEIIIKLIEHDADINARGPYNNTPLHTAAFNGHEGTVQVLISLGALQSYKNNLGQTYQDLLKIALKQKQKMKTE